VLARPNPSTILKLLEVIRSNYALLLEALSDETRRGCLAASEKVSISSARLSQLQAFIGQEEMLGYATLWPNLRAVVTWTGGNCAVLTPKLAGCGKSPPAAFSPRSEAHRTAPVRFASSLAVALLDGLSAHPAAILIPTHAAS